MSYVTAAAGLKAVLLTLRTEGGLRAVLKGAPTSPQALPLAFMEADSGTRMIAGQLTVNTYRVRVSVLVPFQDNVLAEDALEPWINSLPAAIDANATFTGAVKSAQVTDWTAGYMTFDSGDKEIKTRRIEFTVSILEKTNYKTGGN